MNPDRRVPAANIAAFLHEVLAGFAMAPEVARVVVDHLVDASLSGMDSHGLQQITGYADSLRNGRIRASPAPRWLPRERAALLRLDADAAPGQYAALVALDGVTARARDTGFAAVGVTNSNHFGTAGYIVREAARRGFVAFATSDTNVVDLAPWGGSAARIGNNPVAYGIPNGTDEPLVLDFASGATSGGKIRHYGYLGGELPLGWALDAAGAPTRMPAEATVVASTSYRGAGLGLVSDLLCGPLLGTATGLYKRKAQHDADNGTGHFLWTLDVAAFTELESFTSEVRRAVQGMKDVPLLPGATPVLAPGEAEAHCRRERAERGVPVAEGLLAALRARFGQDLVERHLAR